MKSIGMTRPLDPLGRIVIPKEMRETMGYNVGDPIEIFMDEENGLLAFRRYTGVSCNMCGSIDELTYFKDYFICASCIDDLKNDRGVQSKVAHVKLGIEKAIKKPKRSLLSTEKLLQTLKNLIQQKPNLTQKEYAELMSVSQPRISQLKKMLH
ncbi:AbrB/MazE/SpoVT family DNA-binding domain-containing protein [Paenibacillus polymyxa]|uniref:AbrB/MazE/SpoVT family DNA-binding domain-containing protein n=1 Tax=Paenibacillus polymyxa TaxID=1406 RepID=UPI0004DFC163|nr:hypothetical protein [Paenibacillus polymyxa]RPE06781.1 regulator [Paenibacillus polymyxa]